MNTLDKLKETFEQMSDNDILKCIKLKRLYLEARKQEIPTEERMEILVKSLLVATAYEERLTGIKISIKRILLKAEALYTKRKNKIILEDEQFSKKKKYDQENIIKAETENVSLFISKIKDYKDSVQDALDYVRSVQFNIKAILAVFKEHFLDKKSE